MNNRKLFSRVLTIVLASTFSTLALAQTALTPAFTYQGELRASGSPANAAFDMEFRLFSELANGAQIGNTVTRNAVNVVDGLFSTELNFGAAQFAGDAQWLEIRIKPAGSGSFETLVPRTPLTAAPYAWAAANALGNSVTGTSVIDGSVGVVDVNPSQIQARVTQVCAAGSSIREIDASGAVVCEPDDGGAGGGGTVTSVATGAGLTGGPIVSSGTISIATGGVAAGMIANGAVGTAQINTTQVQSRVSGSCAAGSSIRVINVDGTTTCESDDVGSGTVTSVATGTGLTGGPISSSGTIAIAPAGVTSSLIANGAVGTAQINNLQVQSRITGSCLVGASIRVINADGSVSCETDDTPAPSWTLSGNAGTNPASEFIGTTDAQSFVIRTHNSPSLRIEPSAATSGAPAVPITRNMIGGSHANSVLTGARGATISGGGAPTDPNLINADGNRVGDHYGSVGGGFDNVAGDFVGTTSDRAFATVGGGVANTASGNASVVGGGSTNTASGGQSAVLGGLDNLASGALSAIAGGINNKAEGEYGAVLGGTDNRASGSLAAVGGGSQNTASGQASHVSGGLSNCAGGSFSWAGGWDAHVRPGSDSGAGGQGCAGVATSGDTDGDNGTFIWADSQGSSFVSTGPNQFLVRAEGGVAINGTPPNANGGFEFNVFGNTPDQGFVEFGLIPKPSLNGNTGERIELGVGKGAAGGNDADFRIVHRNDSGAFFEHMSIDGDGSVILRSNPANTAQGVQLAIGAGAWSSLSDRNLKTDVRTIEPIHVLDRLLKMPIQQWRYRGQPGSVQHLGPMAQDFAAAFGLGENDTTISTIDADGVALAAIQGLNAKLEAENADLRARLDAIEARLGVQSAE